MGDVTSALTLISNRVISFPFVQLVSDRPPGAGPVCRSGRLGLEVLPWNDLQQVGPRHLGIVTAHIATVALNPHLKRKRELHKNANKVEVHVRLHITNVTLGDATISNAQLAFLVVAWSVVISAMQQLRITEKTWDTQANLSQTVAPIMLYMFLHPTMYRRCHYSHFWHNPTSDHQGKKLQARLLPSRGILFQVRRHSMITVGSSDAKLTFLVVTWPLSPQLWVQLRFHRKRLTVTSDPQIKFFLHTELIRPE